MSKRIFRVLAPILSTLSIFLISSEVRVSRSSIKQYPVLIGDSRRRVSAIHRELIEANLLSTISGDISAIWHYPTNQDICVHLGEGARCPNPDFVGRLSGESFAMLEWKQIVEASNHPHFLYGNEGTVHCGSYAKEWIVPGTYSLDIIVVFCNSYGITSPNMTSDYNGWLKYDFANECLEEPGAWRITDDSAFITIDAEISKEDMMQGRWTHNNYGNNITKPLYTRYQPQFCREHHIGKSVPLPERCAIPMESYSVANFTYKWRDVDLSEKLKPYQMEFPYKAEAEKDWWKWVEIEVYELEGKAHGGSGLDAVHIRRDNKVDKWPKICITGWSHSYHLVHAFWLNQLGHIYIWAKARFPHELDADFFRQYYEKRGCTKFVIGIGQWKASFASEGKDLTFGSWLSEISKIVNNDEIFKIGNGDIKLYFRSMHINTIGDMTGTCAEGHPEDWRNPTVITGYNYLTEKAVADSKYCNSSRVEFIDATFTTFPMW